MKHWTIIFCISIFFCISAGLVHAIDISDCGILGFAGETYTLIANVSTSETTCFTITEPDVTLDCGEFSITANNIQSTNNSGIYSDKNNTIIKNCDKSVQNQDKKALFDIVSEIVSEPKRSGEDLIIKVSLINFGAANQIDANLKYTITDGSGKIIRQYTKIVPVTTQTEFLDHINTTDITNGKYSLKIELNYVGQSFPASTEKVFYVGLIKGLFRNASVKTFLLPSMTLILLFGVYRKSRINKLRETTHDNCIEQLNNIEKNFK